MKKIERVENSNLALALTSLPTSEISHSLTPRSPRAFHDTSNISKRKDLISQILLDTSANHVDRIRGGSKAEKSAVFTCRVNKT